MTLMFPLWIPARKLALFIVAHENKQVEKILIDYRTGEMRYKVKSRLPWWDIIRWGIGGFLLLLGTLMLLEGEVWYAAYRAFFIYVSISIAAWLLFKWLENRDTNRWWKALHGDEPEPEKPKQPNILLEYIKAKKSRFCPLLEFKDD